jgi:hypothetical protein
VRESKDKELYRDCHPRRPSSLGLPSLCLAEEEEVGVRVVQFPLKYSDDSVSKDCPSGKEDNKRDCV